MVSFLNNFEVFFVIPAKAEIHHRKVKFVRQVMDPRLRGGDELWVLSWHSAYSRRADIGKQRRLRADLIGDGFQRNIHLGNPGDA